jgi:hypothetical protein
MTTSHYVDPSHEAYLRMQVWSKATMIDGHDPWEFRFDVNGRTVCWSDYGDYGSRFGWDMEFYPIPEWLGGPRAHFNLRVISLAAKARSNIGS